MDGFKWRSTFQASLSDKLFSAQGIMEEERCRVLEQLHEELRKLEEIEGEGVYLLTELEHNPSFSSAEVMRVLHWKSSLSHISPQELIHIAQQLASKEICDAIELQISTLRSLHIHNQVMK